MKLQKQAHEAHAEPTDVKSKIKAFIKHHVLDSHDFTFLQDDETGEHYGFPLPIILWDNGFKFFILQNSNTEKLLQNQTEISTN